MKFSLAVAGTALLAGTLTACGGGSGGSGGGGGGGDGGTGSNYCKDLKIASANFSSLSSGDTAKFDSVFATFHKLASEAPGSIKSDWQTLDGALTTVQKALDDAGLKFSDLGKPGTDPAKVAGLAKQFSNLNTPAFTKASKDIEAHAKNVCKVDISAVK